MSLSDGTAEALRSLRRDLHRHPEPAWCEFRTTARIVEACDRIGVEAESVIRYNLVLAVRRVATDRPDAVGEAIPTLIDVVATDTDDDVIRTAALALSDVAEADPDAVGHERLSEITDGFQSADAEARQYVAWTLDEAARDSPDLVAETTPALAAALEDPHAGTRTRATRALVRLAQWDLSVVREHAPTLVSNLTHGDSGVADISGRVEYDALRADDDGTACDYTPGSCDFVYFGKSDLQPTDEMAGLLNYAGRNSNLDLTDLEPKGGENQH